MQRPEQRSGRRGPRPIQARPIVREERVAAPVAAGGLVAAQAAPPRSPCDGLTGMARQMCYAQRYGVSA